MDIDKIDDTYKWKGENKDSKIANLIRILVIVKISEIDCYEPFFMPSYFNEGF